jgi:hypothetical protein
MTERTKDFYITRNIWHPEHNPTGYYRSEAEADSALQADQGRPGIPAPSFAHSFDVREARELCEKATAGPWRGIRKSGYVYASDCVTARCGDFSDKELVPFNGERWGNDAEFIAAARSLLPAACDRITSLENQLREVTAERDAARLDAQATGEKLNYAWQERQAAESSLSLATERMQWLEANIERLGFVPLADGERVQVYSFGEIVGRYKSLTEAIDAELAASRISSPDGTKK